MSDTTLILFLIVFLPMVIFLNPYLEKNSKKIEKTPGKSKIFSIFFMKKFAEKSPEFWRKTDDFLGKTQEKYLDMIAQSTRSFVKTLAALSYRSLAL